MGSWKFQLAQPLIRYSQHWSRVQAGGGPPELSAGAPGVIDKSLPIKSIESNACAQDYKALDFIAN